MDLGALALSTVPSAFLARFALTAAAVVAFNAGAPSARQSPRPDAEVTVQKALRSPVPYTVISQATFDRLGWKLPDGGATVKAIADKAPGGAFDPRLLQLLESRTLGYRARWHEVRYRYYGLDWDVTGLLLTPTAPLRGLPTVAFVNGGSANWYEFLVDPLNGPAVAQYLAQRVSVLLVTIPGNYRHGGWTDPVPSRKAAYLLDRTIDDAEASARNAIYTFSLVSEGVAQLIERVTSGPVVIAGHSTGGEIQFLLQQRLKSRLKGLSLGWGTGGPASVRRVWNDGAAQSRNRTSGAREYPPLPVLRPRTAPEYARSYVGPFNPLGPGTPLEVAERWLGREDRRRPQFKQVLQDIEHQGEVDRRDQVIREVRAAIASGGLQVHPETVIADLFSTTTAPLDGYRRMVWTTTLGDDGHWDEDPKRARELFVADAFRRANPDADIRVLVFGVPMSHYGHIERPRQLAGGILAAVKWLVSGR